MNMSVILFQVDDDRFSALAFDIGHQGNVWRNSYGSRKELIRSLEMVGVVTAEEVDELHDGACFAKGSPVFRVSIDRETIEGAGFKRVVSEKPN
jgi:hypothetical protein